MKLVINCENKESNFVKLTNEEKEEIEIMKTKKLDADNKKSELRNEIKELKKKQIITNSDILTILEKVSEGV